MVAKTTGAFYGQAMTAGDIYTIAGNGAYGSSGNGVPATKAALADPEVVALDSAGNVLVADTYDYVIRVVAKSTGTFYGRAMTAGDIYTIAGGGATSSLGDGGPATKASLAVPSGVALDSAGNVLIADEGNQRIRVVAESTGSFYGQAMTAGDIYTVAGNGGFGFSGDGGPATNAEFDGPEDVAVDSAGNLLIADSSNERVRVVAKSTGTFYGQAMTAGDIYTIAGNGTAGFAGDGGPAISAEFDDLQDVSVDNAGNVLIADTFNDRVRVVAGSTGTFYGRAMTAGDVYTIAGNGDYSFSGDGGPATTAQLGGPSGVAVDGTGNVLIADESNDRIRVVAKSTGSFYGQTMTAGDIYTIAGNDVAGFSGDGGAATSAELDYPDGVAVDQAGNLVISDTYNQRIRVVAESNGTFYGRAMTAGDIYTIAGNGTSGFAGDGGPATRAELSSPAGVAVDSGDNVVVADRFNSRIRVVAESTGTFYGKAMNAGDIYTSAGNGDLGFSGDGGPATKAKLYSPAGVALDSAGNAVIADTANSRVRVVAERTGTFYGKAMTAGDIYTIAGTAEKGFSGDGGQATRAKLKFPYGVTVDSAGNVVIADTSNERIRVVAERNGTFYGKTMRAGDIYTVVGGTGVEGFSGDGGPAAKAEVSIPSAVAIDGEGNLIIADTGNNRVRQVAG